jgi:hypothetical protein
MDARSLRRQVLLSTTMLVGALTSYGSRTYAACVNTVGTTFECSGAETTQQNITTNNANVLTLPGFSVITGDARAVNISADGALSFTDVNASTLTAADRALSIVSTGDAGATPGSVTVVTNGNLSSTNQEALYADNEGTGALSVIVNGDVTSTNSRAVYAFLSTNGTDLSVTTGVGTMVTGTYGIRARDFGTGALTIIANGDVTGSSNRGINAISYNGTDLSVTTGAGTTITGGNFGIDAYSSGSGALEIVTNGDVTGGTDGIFARNFGTDALSIVANGDVTGTTLYGIYARNDGTDLTVTRPKYLWGHRRHLRHWCPQLWHRRAGRHR